MFFHPGSIITKYHRYITAYPMKNSHDLHIDIDRNSPFLDRHSLIASLLLVTSILSHAIAILHDTTIEYSRVLSTLHPISFNIT